MAGFGLRYGRSQGMDGYTGNMIEFPIDPANTNPIFKGDVVVLNAGFVEDAAGGTPGDIAAGAILGVFQGWRDLNTQARLGGNDSPFAPFWDGSAGAQEPVAHIAMPPHSLFYIRGTDALTQADVGSRFLINYQAGDPRTADSRSVLGAVDAAGPVQLHRLAPMPNNNWGDPEPIVEVAIVAQQGTASDAA